MALSPMMQHYISVKEEYPDAILFYRLGDFYEMFFDDAIEMSKVLDITLTGKDCGLDERAPMCGVPYHSVDSYIAKLIKEGYKIAICEQVGEVKKGKTVERAVVRVITPGTVTEDNLLEENKNNYILCVSKNKNTIGVAYADISTGDFYTTEFKNTTNSQKFDNNYFLNTSKFNEEQDLINQVNDLIVRINPSEIICNENAKELLNNIPANKLMTLPKFYSYYEWAFKEDKSIENLKKQFTDSVLKIYELNFMMEAVNASGALIEYLNETQKRSLEHIKKITKIDNNKFMILDVTARRNLELVETIRERKKKGSLLYLLDNTKTSMGSRLLRNWIDQPLKDTIEINNRLDAVEELCQNIILRDDLTDQLRQINDIERLTSKIGLSIISPKECVRLKKSLEVLPKIKFLISNCSSKLIKEIFDSFDDFSQIYQFLDSAIKNEPSQHLRDGDIIKDKFDKNLDKLRQIKNDSDNLMLELEQREQEKTGIKSLRIKFNNVYGYYIEVSRSLVDQVPSYFHRKQTVSNFDRYFTEELKDLEIKILKANDESIKLEQIIFNNIKNKLKEYIEKFQFISKKLSELDCLLSFAQISIKNNYTKPLISDKIEHIKIIEGRHPVVENFLKDSQFIPNDTFLNESTDKLMIITGPNMAGKSTYMRQVAIITLMAHIGCFVPAKSAEISITDRIFTRVGASDDLAFGQSTFMVEMTEMANILNNATDNSLVILDEIGRGTSTFDGLSIAWAVVEHLSRTMKTKTLFATHYHELTELEGMLDGVKNYKINVKEINNNIVFLRKIVRGGASRSFGIEVAALAGLPQNIINRAKEISHNIEQYDFNLNLAKSNKVNSKQENNTLNENKNIEIIKFIKNLQIERLSPLEAFDILSEIIKKINN